MTLYELVDKLLQMQIDHKLTGDEKVVIEHWAEEGSDGSEYMSNFNEEIKTLELEKNVILIRQECAQYH